MVIISVAMAFFGCGRSDVDAALRTANLGLPAAARDALASAAAVLEDEAQVAEETVAAAGPDAAALFAALGVVEDYRAEFVHGEKPAEYQKYIVLHDTESWGNPASVIAYWDGNDSGVAAHFIVDVDGSVWQCVPLDKIAHHAGFGDAGHNTLYGVEEDARDDRIGTSAIGPAFPDYGMNSYSVGIELVHVGGGGEYPVEQLEALDALIAYIDAYYGFESEIIDHKAWRTGNSDTSAEFAWYLENYRTSRSYAG